MILRKNPSLVARRLWARQSASRVASAISTYIFGSVVRIKWKISPIKIKQIHKPDNGLLAPFAYSRASSSSGILESYRVISHLDSTASLNSTIWCLSNSQAKHSGIIPGAEDARVFQFAEKLYLYYQVSFVRDNGSLDCRIHVFEPISSETWEVRSALNFNGKNWIPFEKSGELYFIYSLEPLILLKVKKWRRGFIEAEVFYDQSSMRSSKLVWGDEKGFFGSIRGGSQLIEVQHNIYLGFTHITPEKILKFSHQAGVILFNFTEMSFQHFELTKLTPGLLVDPFGIEVENSKVRMFYSYSINNPHEFTSTVGSSSALFDISRFPFTT